MTLHKKAEEVAEYLYDVLFIAYEATEKDYEDDIKRITAALVAFAEAQIKENADEQLGEIASDLIDQIRNATYEECARIACECNYGHKPELTSGELWMKETIGKRILALKGAQASYQKMLVDWDARVLQERNAALDEAADITHEACGLYHTVQCMRIRELKSEAK